MNKALDLFNNSIDSVKSLHVLHKHLCKLLPAMDLSEILRAEVVLIVSAFDCYIHNIVRQQLIYNFNSDISDENSKFDEFPIPAKVVKQLMDATDERKRNELLEVSLKKILSKDSYQSPLSIEYALQLVGIKKVWSSIKDDMSMTPSDIKNQLGLIINRRNKIAHEADVKNLVDTSKNEIDREDLNGIFNFITKLVTCIDALF